MVPEENLPSAPSAEGSRSPRPARRGRRSGRGRRGRGGPPPAQQRPRDSDHAAAKHPEMREDAAVEDSFEQTHGAHEQEDRTQETVDRERSDDRDAPPQGDETDRSEESYEREDRERERQELPQARDTRRREPAREAGREREQSREKRQPASKETIQQAIDDVNQISDTLRDTLDEVDELLELLEIAERQETASQQEIDSLRRALRNLQRPRGGGGESRGR
jgi:hypothetical protein